MKIKFRNVDTGEIIEVNVFDSEDSDEYSEAFEECVFNENYQLIFD